MKKDENIKEEIKKIYDLIIIGGGPAGLSTGIYAGRGLLSTLLIENKVFGGQISQTHEIENYPGGITGEAGYDLVERMLEQCKLFKVEFLNTNITGVELNTEIKKIKTTSGELLTKTIVIASGNDPIKLDVKGGEEFIGKGISYCGTCDAPFFKNLQVFVIGGGNTAVEEALFLARFAKEVTIIHRRDKLRASKSLQEKLNKQENIKFLWNYEVEEIKGDEFAKSIVIKNMKTDELTEIKAEEGERMIGVFVFIGHKPNTELFSNIHLSENGYIKTDERMRTSIPGVFAAGDVREKRLRQVATAVGDGSIAAVEVENYLTEDEEK